MMEKNIGQGQAVGSEEQQQLEMFWSYQRQEIDRSNELFRNHQLPLARIKKIMKADEDVRMISAEAPVLFSKACELFILELTIRSWNNANNNKRRTLNKSDIAAAVSGYQFFDFLVDIVPPPAEEEVPANGVTWSYPQQPQPMGMMPQGDLYNVQMPSSAWQSVWDAPDDDSYVSQGNGDGQS